MTENLNKTLGQPKAKTDMDYQIEFHRENQARITALETITREIAASVTTIAANTSCIPSLVERVDNLESDRDKLDTGLKMIWVVLGLPTGSVMLWVGSHVNWGGMFH